MFSVTCLLFWMLAMLVLVAGTIFSREHFGRGVDRLDMPFALYPVSILKPLKGADEGLRENLESFFRLDYPFYEILFSVSDVFDPAYAVASELMSKYPKIPSRILIGTVEAGSNPKINNLIKSYESAKYDWLLISDSNVRVSPEYLKRQVAHIRPNVGMVTAVVRGTHGRGVGGELEAMFLNTFYTRGMVLTSKLGRPCVVGKSMLFRKTTSDRFGGMKALGCYLAEDFMAGEAVRKLGMDVIVAKDPVDQYLGQYSIHEFWSRHVRWGRIRKAQAPIAFAIEPFLTSVGSAVLGAIAFSRLFEVPAPLFLAAHFSVWATCDGVVLSAIRIGESSASILAWALREMMSLPLWLHILCGNSVMWRGKKLTLHSGGLIT